MFGRASTSTVVAPRRADTSRGGFATSLQRHQAFRQIWLASVSSQAGQWMQTVALGWIALIMTNSAAFVGLVSFVSGVPYLFVGPFGASLIDRVDRRKLLLVLQLGAVILSLAIAVDVIGGFVQPWHLIAAGFLNGALQSLLSPTQQSIVADVVPREDLTNAIGLMSAGQNMTRIVGPSIAGAIIGFVGAGETFLVQAALVAIALVLIWRTVLPQRERALAANRSALEGIRLVAARPDLRSLFLLAAIPSLFIFPYISFLNVIARDVLDIGAQGLGILMAASGFGSLVGSLYIAGRGRSQGMVRQLLVFAFVYCGMIMIACIAAQTTRQLLIAAPLFAVGSCLASVLMSGNNVALQHRISDDVRGRVTGVYMLTWGLMPLGALPMGIVANQVGAPAALFIGAVICAVLLAVLVLSSPVLKEL